MIDFYRLLLSSLNELRSISAPEIARRDDLASSLHNVASEKRKVITGRGRREMLLRQPTSSRLFRFSAHLVFV